MTTTKTTPPEMTPETKAQNKFVSLSLEEITPEFGKKKTSSSATPTSMGGPQPSPAPSSATGRPAEPSPAPSSKTGRHRTVLDMESMLKSVTASATAEGLFAEQEVERIADEFTKSKFTESKWFSTFVAVAVFVNTVQMGIEVDRQISIDWLEHALTAVFLFEMICRLLTERCGYFRCGWNLMDFFLVTIAIVDAWILRAITGASGGVDISYLRILKSLKVVRAVRLLKIFKELWLIIQGILSSVKTILWVSLLLGMILYVCAIFTCQMIGRNPEYATYEAFDPTHGGVIYSPDDFVAYKFFGTIPRAMYTLFNIALFSGDWDEVGRAVIEVQPGMFLFFLAFIMFTTFGLMNVIIGVIVDNTIEAGARTKEDIALAERAEKLQTLQTLTQAYFACDTDSDGYITPAELECGLRDPEARKKLEALQRNVPYGADIREVFELLDSNGDGKVAHSEFVRNLFRLIDQTPEHQWLYTQLAVHKANRRLQILTENLVVRQPSSAQELKRHGAGAGRTTKEALNEEDPEAAAFSAVFCQGRASEQQPVCSPSTTLPGPVGERIPGAHDDLSSSAEIRNQLSEISAVLGELRKGQREQEATLHEHGRQLQRLEQVVQNGGPAVAVVPGEDVPATGYCCVVPGDNSGGVRKEAASGRKWLQ